MGREMTIKVYLDGQEEPIGELAELTFDAKGIIGSFDLFGSKKGREPKVSPDKLRELLAGSYSSSFDYEPLPRKGAWNWGSWEERNAQGSGGTFPPEADWWEKIEKIQKYARETMPSVPILTRGTKKVKDATFATLVLRFEGQEHEVIWFEGEGLPDVLERMAQSMR